MGAENVLTETDWEMMGRPPTCYHQEECLWLTKKLGPNYGRAFWRCPREMGNQCNFFGWTPYQPHWLPPGSPMNPHPPSLPRTPPLPSKTTPAPTTPGSMSTASSKTMDPKCKHKNVTRQGSTGTTVQEKCKDCGKILKKGPRNSETESENFRASSSEEDDRRRDGGIPGVPGVPQVAEGSTETGFKLGDLSIEPDEIQDLIKPVCGKRARHVKRVVSQARAALDTAEQIWSELMSLVCTEPENVIETGWQRFESEVMDPNDPNRVKNQKAAHKLKIAKRLFRFAMKIGKLVMSYGCHFLLEHPLTSSAWLEDEMQRLMEDDRVLLVATDQCMFGLKSSAGNLHKKPTGFVTNSPEIAAELEVRCDHRHQHEQVIGNNETGNRARQAQVYPSGLVDAILRGYRRQVKIEEEINFIGWQELRDDALHRNFIVNEIYATAETFQKHPFADIQNVAASVEHRVLTNDLVFKNDPVLNTTEVSNELFDLEDDDGEEAIGEESPDVEDEVRAEGGEAEPVVERQNPRLPRERPFSVEQLVRRAHEGLGHPGNDRLARILKNANASAEAIKIAKELKCSVCDQHAALRPARRAAPPRQLHVNEIVGIDTVYIPDVERRRRPALNIVDWASRFQMIIPLRRHTASETRRAYLQWVKIFGPPTKLYVDLGREFLGAFELGAEQDSTIVEPSSLEMPTQRGITERAGRSFKEVFSRTLQQYACQDEEEWRQLVDVANMTCNRLMNKSGYSPIQRVLGYSPRIPGGALSGGANDLATMSLRAGDLQVQRAAQMRLAAAKAFHEADCSQALKNALHAGPRQRTEYEVGQVVYFCWKGMEGAKKNGPEYWRGPCRVILTPPPSTIWVNYKGYIVRAAPEHLRLASEEEQFTLSKWIDDIAETKRELEAVPRQGYIDLTDEPIPLQDGECEDGREPPGEPAQIPKYRLVGKRDQQNVVFRDDDRSDEWMVNEDQGKLIRWHYQPRSQLFKPTEALEGCPVPLHRLYGRRLTYGNWVNTGEHFTRTDDRLVVDNQAKEMTAWTGRTEFEIKENRSRMAEVVIPASLAKWQRTEEPRIETEENEAIVNDDVPTNDEVPVENQASAENEETGDLPRGEVRQRDGEAEDGDESEERRNKRLRTEFIELYLTQVEKILAAKAKKEVVFKNLDKNSRKQFINAINKEIKNNLNTGAYEVLSPEESERIRRDCPEKIVKSRFVFTEKPIEADEVEQTNYDGLLLKDDGENSTKAKARHVMKGFSENEAENLETTTPQCGRDTVMCTLQMICSHLWKPGYLDFTQAFHSGDDIDREVYASQPTECHLPGYHPRQLLRLKKTCYGLLDGPFAWYQHLKKILTEVLGYTQSAGDPCLFYLWNSDDHSLQGVISVATDDLLHGGNQQHWRKMEWLNKNYKLGKFSTGDGRFVGKEIKCQKDGSFLVHQPLFAQKIQSIPIEKNRKKQRYSYCTPEEISQLRGLLGSLAWLAKETRPDLAGRVAILQQSMPIPFVQDLIEANVLAKEAVTHAQLGVKIQPIPLQHLRVGTVSDASWGNVKHQAVEPSEDFWEEKEQYWIRHHRLPRRLLFHAAGAPHGPNCHDLQGDRVTIMDGSELRDQWNQRDSIREGQPEMWCGQTIFFKKVKDHKVENVKDKFVQHGRLASQGGFITFFYDARMETEEKAYPISIVNWKSFRIKRCTVNTLSAECQAMLQGVGALHWLRFMIQEIHGKELHLETWEKKIGEIPCIAVTDSKSLYDTITKCCNTGAHIEDKRTAIDVTILKRDFIRTQGQVRWIEGTRMISDSLTEKMGSVFLRKVMISGKWSLSELGFQEEHNALLYLISAKESLAGVSAGMKETGCRLGDTCRFCHLCSREQAKSDRLRVKYEVRRNKRLRSLHGQAEEAFGHSTSGEE
eukprot:s3051_g15.t1